MAIAVFFLLALVAAGVIAVPLLPGRTPDDPHPVVTAGDIDQAVGDVRFGRALSSGRACPACGHGYEPGDRFCVRCGESLPGGGGGAGESACPSCGAGIHEGDRFCPSCGHNLAPEEAP